MAKVKITKEATGNTARIQVRDRRGQQAGVTVSPEMQVVQVDRRRVGVQGVRVRREPGRWRRWWGWLRLRMGGAR